MAPAEQLYVNTCIWSPSHVFKSLLRYLNKFPINKKNYLFIFSPLLVAPWDISIHHNEIVYHLAGKYMSSQLIQYIKNQSVKSNQFIINKLNSCLWYE